MTRPHGTKGSTAMTQSGLVVDTNVVSYIFREDVLGEAYLSLIGERDPGITFLSIAELRSGVVSGNWGDRRIARLDAALSRFTLLGSTMEIANVCGGILGTCKRIGLAMTWPDAWSAATAMWLDLPLVTHDRDLEGIPGLRVLTVHQQWRVGEESFATWARGGLWLGESREEQSSPIGVGRFEDGGPMNLPRPPPLWQPIE
jgi:tRNA(fMet)-specific endonuclease VapC